MFFALCRLEVFIPEGRSLKGKRSVISSIKERLRARFHASVVEVSNQDLRQRGTLAVALVGNQPSALESALAAMRRLVEQEPRCYVTSWETRVEPFDGAPGAPQRWRGAADTDGGEPAWDEPVEGDELFGATWSDRETGAHPKRIKGIDRPGRGGEVVRPEPRDHRRGHCNGGRPWPDK